MSKRTHTQKAQSRKFFRAPAATAAVAGILSTMSVFSPIAIQEANAAETVTETINTTLSCQSFNVQTGLPATRTYQAPQQITVTYPKYVATGEKYQVKYQLSQGTVTNGGGSRGYIGRITFDVTLPNNATIDSAAVTSTGTNVSGFNYRTNTYHRPPTVFRYDSTAAGDTRDPNGMTLRMMGDDYPGRPDFSEAYPRSGNDAGYGIGFGTGRGSKLQFGTYQLPEVTVDVTAGQTDGEFVNFGLRNAGSLENASIANNKELNYANTLGFVEWYDTVTTLCRPNDAALAKFASTKVIAPHKPNFTLAVGDPASDNNRTITATMPDPLIKGTVTFKARNKTTGQVTPLGAQTITNGVASVTAPFDPANGYEIIATLNSTEPTIFQESTKTATIKSNQPAADTEITATPDPETFTVRKPGTLKVAVAPKGGGTGTPVGNVTISYDNGQPVTATLPVGTDGTVTFPDITFAQAGTYPVEVKFTPEDGTPWNESTTTADITVEEPTVAATITPFNDTPVYAGIPSQLKARLDDDTLTGTVQFFDVTDPNNPVPLGSPLDQANGVPVTGGTATLDNAIINVSGDRQIKAVFTPTGSGTTIEGTETITVIGPQDGGTLPATGGRGIWSTTAAALMIIVAGVAAAVGTRRRYAA
ncbi:hypothetical protein [Corynebacterium aquatimens]|uniref:Ig-like domain (Group 3) n=1 Tax=Corynebacterium aquatimens TaxID=1190508 RepID=A0A931GY01_9CORY|nr:hypothetical protein [Corynebacterium aquatimens]MBG6122939.1 hypothetical protein [Corynebacterium aquatimens]WJY66726.1 hypothetical protein CAQUA_10195 [Corynebacterium aquatimens]